MIESGGSSDLGRKREEANPLSPTGERSVDKLLPMTKEEVDNYLIPGSVKGKEQSVSDKVPSKEIFNSESKEKPRPQKMEKTSEKKPSHIEDEIILPKEEGEYPTLPAIFGERVIGTPEQKVVFSEYLDVRIQEAIEDAPELDIQDGGRTTVKHGEANRATGAELRDLAEDDLVEFDPPEEGPGIVFVDSPYEYYDLLTKVHEGLDDNGDEETRRAIMADRDEIYRHELAHAESALRNKLEVLYGVAFIKEGFIPHVQAFGTASKAAWRELHAAPVEPSEVDRIMLDSIGPAPKPNN